MKGRAESEEGNFGLSGAFSEYRRSGDPRYYKGVEYADVVESLHAAAPRKPSPPTAIRRPSF